MFRLLRLVSILCALSARAAELTINFDQDPLGVIPPHFTNALAGAGTPGLWEVIDDASVIGVGGVAMGAASHHQVLAQLSADPADERFPMLIYDGINFGDFTLTTSLKNVSGTNERIAGVAFRIQDEKNYYYVRASSKGSTFRFYKVVNGVRGDPVGADLEIASGVWHSLTIECKGNTIHFLLDGKEPMALLTDNTFSVGRIGFWTKSDAVAYFSDTRILYTPVQTLAEALVEAALRKHPELVDLRIYAAARGEKEPRVIASKQPKELGDKGNSGLTTVLDHNTVAYIKDLDGYTVALPLRDRNGEALGAVEVKLPTFKGETEKTAATRAMPIAKEMELRTLTAKSLSE